MGEEILKLRSEGKSYNRIVEILGCSKSTVSYHCGKGQKEKSKRRQKINREKFEYKLKSKIDGFCRNKVRNFKRFSRPNQLTNSKINYKKAFRKLLDNPKCYLTGELINLEDIKSYQLDHIIPVSKGGKNTLRNMGLTLSVANRAKTDMSVKEFLIFCEKVLNNFK